MHSSILVFCHIWGTQEHQNDSMQNTVNTILSTSPESFSEVKDPVFYKEGCMQVVFLVSALVIFPYSRILYL